MVYYEYKGFLDTDLLAIIMIVASPIFIFYGIKFVYVVLGVLGALAGGYGAHYVMRLIVEYSHTTIPVNYYYIAIALVGISTGILLVKFTRIGIFALGAVGMLFAGNAAFYFVLENWVKNPPESIETIHIVAMVLFALGGGILSIFLVERILMRVLSAFAGGYMFVGAVDYGLKRGSLVDQAPLAPQYFFHSDPGNFNCTGQINCYVLIVVWFLLFFAGVIVQFKKFKDKKKKPGKDSKTPNIIVVKEVRSENDSESDSYDDRRKRKRRSSKK